MLEFITYISSLVARIIVILALIVLNAILIYNIYRITSLISNTHTIVWNFRDYVGVAFVVILSIAGCVFCSVSSSSIVADMVSITRKDITPEYLKDQ